MMQEHCEQTRSRATRVPIIIGPASVICPRDAEAQMSIATDTDGQIWGWGRMVIQIAAARSARCQQPISIGASEQTSTSKLEREAFSLPSSRRESPHHMNYCNQHPN